MSRILITGSHGQVGHALKEIFSSHKDCHSFDSNEADLTDENKLRKLIQELKPEVIINAAAYTEVDHAENDQLTAFKVNARGPQIIGQEATTVGAVVIHFSSDYVFDGKKMTPYVETDKTNPLNIYGASKLEGEKLLMAACPRSLILRTSWIVSAHGNNFLKTILKSAKEKEALRIVSDQKGVPTPANLLASIIEKILHRLTNEDLNHFPFGIYHVVPSGETNWFDYAKLILSEAIKYGDTFKVTPELIHSIKTEAHATTAKRPLNSMLDTTLFQKTFDIALPSWEEGVFDIMKTIYKVS